MTTANAIQKCAGHPARRVREEPPPSRGIPRSGGHVRFPTGKLYATPGAVAALERAGDFGRPYSVQQANKSLDRMSLVLPYLRRHVWGDWGDVSVEDARANEAALREDARIFSAYGLATGERLWIITEADRSSTTVLLPDEY